MAHILCVRAKKKNEIKRKKSLLKEMKLNVKPGAPHSHAAATSKLKKLPLLLFVAFSCEDGTGIAGTRGPNKKSSSVLFSNKMSFQSVRAPPRIFHPIHKIFPCSGPGYLVRTAGGVLPAAQLSRVPVLVGASRTCHFSGSVCLLCRVIQ